MKSRIMAQGPEILLPRYPGTNIPAGQPLPPGTSVAQTVATFTNGFNAETFLGWINTFDAATKQPNVQAVVPQGVDFSGLASMAAAGASAGAAIGGVGAIVGAVAATVAWVAQNWNRLFGAQTPPHYANAQVHAWATAYLPQAVLDWSRANDPNVQFQSISQMAQACLCYWLETGGLVVVAGMGTRLYSGVLDDTYINALGVDPNEFYRPLGVNYQATRALRVNTGNRDQRHVAQYKAEITLPDDAQDQASTGTGAVLVVGGLIAAGAYLAAKNK